MSNRKYDLAVFIGRFQPLHKGHEHIVAHANDLADRTLVLIGSAHKPRSPKNPLTFDERSRLFHSLGYNTLTTAPIIDTIYDDTAWISQVQYQIESAKKFKDDTVCIVGYAKDMSSEYLKWFPNYARETVTKPYIMNNQMISATDIRAAYYDVENRGTYYASQFLSTNVYHDVLRALQFDVDDLIRWHEYNEDYELEWGRGPHVTTDALVVQSGHVLLIKRKSDPGKNLWALPGGFLNRERVIDGMIRELREETCLKIPEKVLRGSIVDSEVFDHPDRSERSHILSHVFHIKLDDTSPLPKVRGADDAAKAEWVPISIIKQTSFREQMFEDHADIIDRFI